jgi:prepilin-type N-terminal cleavage/methylation domain-containing protein
MKTKCMISKQNVRIRLAPRTLRNSKKTGFTLIELLVVIAIIALLLAVLVPALRIAKEKGGLAVCLHNARQLSMAWFAYQGENKGVMVRPGTAEGCWVREPLGPDGKEWKGAVTEKEEKRGIEAGTLFPYTNAPDAYHCPVDTKRKRISNNTKIFRTYSLSEAVGGKIKKYHEIKLPGVYYNFIEEADCREYNIGSWSFKTPTTAAALGEEDQGWRWQDPMAVNHGKSGVLGFCDGHAECHIWVDPWTKERIVLYQEIGNGMGYGDFDLKYFIGSRVKFNDLNDMGKGWADRSFSR